MRYKNNVIDKLVHLEAITNRIQFQVNRGVDQEQLLDSVDHLKDQIEKIREIISLETDEFAEQFANR